MLSHHSRCGGFFAVIFKAFADGHFTTNPHNVTIREMGADEHHRTRSFSQWKSAPKSTGGA